MPHLLWIYKDLSSVDFEDASEPQAFHHTELFEPHCHTDKNRHVLLTESCILMIFSSSMYKFFFPRRLMFAVVPSRSDTSHCGHILTQIIDD